MLINLDRCEEETDDDAGSGTGAGGMWSRLGGEYSRYSVGLRDDCSVAESVAEANEEPHDSAGEVRGFGDDDEGGGEWEEGADDENTTEFSATGSDNRSVPVLPENSFTTEIR